MVHHWGRVARRGDLGSVREFTLRIEAVLEFTFCFVEK